MLDSRSFCFTSTVEEEEEAEKIKIFIHKKRFCPLDSFSFQNEATIAKENRRHDVRKLFTKNTQHLVSQKKNQQKFNENVNIQKQPFPNIFNNSFVRREI